MIDRADDQHGTTLLRLTSAVALITVVLFSMGASSLLDAIDVKSEASDKNRLEQTGKIGAFGEIDRGPRGKNEIALTFDVGAEAECA